MKTSNRKKQKKSDHTEEIKGKVQPKFRKQYWSAIIVLAVAPFLLYGYSTTFGYVLDDEIVISENAFVKKGIAGIKEIMTTESFTGYLGTQQDLVAGARYRPLSLVMFAIEYQLFGLNPKVGHFINVFLYALTGILMLWMVSILFRDSGNEKWFLAIPFVSALLFVVHPVHTEVVANIKSRDEILSMLFSLLTIYSTFQFSATGKIYQAVLSAIFLMLALLAKENAITFIAVVPLALYFFTKVSIPKILRASLPLFIAAAVYLLLRYQVIGYLLDSGKEITGLMNNPFLEATESEKYATIFYTLGLYIKLLFFPHPLTHDYYPYQIPLVNWDDLRAIIPLLLYAAMIVFALYSMKKRSVISFCILYFIATISIASNIVFPIGTFMNERFLYMPSLGFCIFIAFVLVKISENIRSEKWKIALPLGIIIVIVFAFSIKTIARVPDWKDTFTLDKADVKISKNSARANCFMGYALYRKGLEAQAVDEKRELFDEATPYIDRALSIHSTYPDALTTKAGLLGGYYQMDGDLDKLLQGFYGIQLSNPIPFVDEYLDYLDRTASSNKLRAFYNQLGAALKKKGNSAKANYYFSKAGKTTTP